MNPSSSEQCPRQNWFERHRKTTIVCFILLLLLLLDMLAGWIFQPTEPGIPHPVYHHDFYPLMTVERGWGEKRYQMHTNSLGFKDASPRTVPLKPTGPRWLFIGDSMTEGAGLAYEETFVGQIDKAVAPDGIEVLNAAVASYSPKLYNEKVRYLAEAQRLVFQELHVFLDISDIQDEVIYKAFTPRRPKLLPPSWDGWLFRHSFYYREYHRWGRPLDRKLRHATGYSKEREDWTYNDVTYQTYGREGTELARKHMEELVTFCRTRKIAMTIAVYPWPGQIRARDLDSQQVAIWRSFCEDQGVAFLNLFPLFVGSGLPEKVVETYYWNKDVHLNATGHTALAKAWLAKFHRDLVPLPRQAPQK